MEESGRGQGTGGITPSVACGDSSLVRGSQGRRTTLANGDLVTAQPSARDARYGCGVPPCGWREPRTGCRGSVAGYIKGISVNCLKKRGRGSDGIIPERSAASSCSVVRVRLRESVRRCAASVLHPARGRSRRAARRKGRCCSKDSTAARY